jgi:endonuclease/exonuclease/phosphatase family metal-dependent hydrolase
MASERSVGHNQSTIVGYENTNQATQVPDTDSRPAVPSRQVRSGHRSRVAPGKPGKITVMTWNLYLGADMGPLALAARTGDRSALVNAASVAWATVVKTDFPTRAKALAREIEQAQPLLVGLQEVSLYRTGPVDSSSGTPPNAHEVKYDYLNILCQELDERGLPYEPVAVNENFEAKFPGITAEGPRDIRLTDRDVILAPTDPGGTMLKLSNVQVANFTHNLSLPVGQTGLSVSLTRGWCSVDVTAGDERFRFINTHLDPYDNEVQGLQGEEILNGPAKTDLPVILLGDFNTRADGTGTPTYGELVGAGFKDAWSVTHPNGSGYTFGHLPDLSNTTTEGYLTERIDLVLFRGALSALDAGVVGGEPSARTPSGLWPSDHAGVVATLEWHKD